MAFLFIFVEKHRQFLFIDEKSGNFVPETFQIITIMAIPITNIPVLTGEVAERFIEQCEYNAQHLRGSEYRGEFEDIYKDIIARSPILQK